MRLLRNVAISAAVWVFVGVPIAAAICFIGFSAYVLLDVPRMAEVAAVAGVVYGLWLHLVASSTSRQPALGAVFGAALGLLAFPPVFYDSELMLQQYGVVALIAGAAVIGGSAAGAVSGTFVRVPAKPVVATLAGKLAICCLTLVSLVFVDQHFYWAATAERLPVPEVSRWSLRHLKAGNARGSSWSGCYWYSGRTPLNQGVERGIFQVVQNDGRLRVFTYPTRQQRIEMNGGVDGNGRFRFGGESKIGNDTLRDLWQGKFGNNSLHFVRRSTWLTGARIVSGALTGSADRTDCSQWFKANSTTPDTFLPSAPQAHPNRIRYTPVLFPQT